MPLLKERGHPWYWNEAFLVEIFCWIKPKSTSDIWAHSNKKAMLDARLMSFYYGLVPMTCCGFCILWHRKMKFFCERLRQRELNIYCFLYALQQKCANTHRFLTVWHFWGCVSHNVTFSRLSVVVPVNTVV